MPSRHFTFSCPFPILAQRDYLSPPYSRRDVSMISPPNQPTQANPQTGAATGSMRRSSARVFSLQPTAHDLSFFWSHQHEGLSTSSGGVAPLFINLLEGVIFHAIVCYLLSYSLSFFFCNSRPQAVRVVFGGCGRVADKCETFPGLCPKCNGGWKRGFIISYSACLLSSTGRGWSTRLAPWATLPFFVWLWNIQAGAVSYYHFTESLSHGIKLQTKILWAELFMSEFQFTEHRVAIALSHQLRFTNIFLTGNCCCSIICSVQMSNW